MIGKTLGHYKITSPLGKGGMGEVYQAKDQKLGRDVAIKVLPEEFAKDTDRIARFQREAKLLASLNHPNIAAIHGLEESSGTNFLVLELVEGETLADQIKRGPIPVEESLKLALQIAEALEAAHEKGVIHRDLKPANIKVTPEGKVKVLDFGLAKAFAAEQSNLNLSNSPTLSDMATQQGIILGTAAYMSPEQARGKPVDKRTDIWAFGCILYECLTGKMIFEGETVTETLAAILKGEPNWSALPATTPQNIQFLLGRCLEKDRNRRFRDAADVRMMIEEKQDIGVATAPANQRHSRSAWSIVAICLIGLFVLGYLYFRKVPVEVQDVLLELNTPATSEPTSFAMSPDGRCLALVASEKGKKQLWLRPLDKKTAQPLMGTEGATFPFWSPDSRSIGFFAGGKLKRIQIAGGMPVALAGAPTGLGGTWSRDDVIVFTPNMGNPLYRVPATGGDAVAVTQLNAPSQTHSFPRFLPDGRRLLYYTWGADPGIYLASLDSGKSKNLFNAGSPAIYSQPGYLLFLRQGTLFSQPFDAERGEASGEPVQIADSVAQSPIYNAGGFSVSETGMLAYRPTGVPSLRQLVWFDRSGKEIAKLGEPADYLSDPEISPHGDQVALDGSMRAEEGGNNRVWLIEATRGVSRKFTNETEYQTFPVWSPDASQIVFSTYRKAAWDLHQMPASGAGRVEILLESLNPGIFRFANDWSRDGKFLLYLSVDPKTNRDLWVLPMSGSERKPFPLEKINTPYEEQNGQFSPDSQWIAYQSNELGKFEVYVEPFQRPGAKVRISPNGGVQPRWNPNGNELFYIAPDGMLTAAPIQIAGQSLNVGDPVALFPSRIPRGGYMDIMRIQYDISRDGKHFLMNTTEENSAPSPIIIDTNWTRMLKK
jgi:eukaryotic-like serine/threonine-protein kinase